MKVGFEMISKYSYFRRTASKTTINSGSINNHIYQTEQFLFIRLRWMIMLGVALSGKNRIVQLCFNSRLAATVNFL